MQNNRVSRKRIFFKLLTTSATKILRADKLGFLFNNAQY